ncbi:RNA-dependent RNA polymerase [Trichonephila clavipes]|nr:RNA-dependent RNA polymerase [Trichonephila clavipes]
MDDNARIHRASIVDECLQSEDSTGRDWPAYSPDLNPIEHVWDMLGPRIEPSNPLSPVYRNFGGGAPSDILRSHNVTSEPNNLSTPVLNAFDYSIISLGSLPLVSEKVDPDLEYPGWERYKESAIKSRNKFNTLLNVILRNYGIKDEAEIFSGTLTNLHLRFKERNDRNEIERVSKNCMKRLFECMNKEFSEEFQESCDVKEFDERMLRKASAWYIVTYRESNAKFLSFPWTISKILTAMKLRKNRCSLSVFPPIVEKMNEQIKLCELKQVLPQKRDSYLWQKYDNICHSKIVELAFRVLLLWAQGEGVLRNGERQGLVAFNTFLKLFLHVAEMANYIMKKNGNDFRSQNRITSQNLFSAASLCLEFLRFCLRLRSCNEVEVTKKVPFQIKKYKKLSKVATITYHSFALHSDFQTLYWDSYIEERSILMKPIYIEHNGFFLLSPHLRKLILSALKMILEDSKAEYVTVRQICQIKKIIISAAGNEESLRALKFILKEPFKNLQKVLENN